MVRRATHWIGTLRALGLVLVTMSALAVMPGRSVCGGLAIAILIYAGMRAAIALRSFYFFQRIEQLEVEARRVMALFAEQGAQPPLKKQTIADVTLLRRDGEVKSYIDLFFLAAVVLLCVSKIMAS